MKRIFMPAALIAVVGLWACTDTPTMPSLDAPIVASYGFVVDNPTLPEGDTNPSSTCPDGVDGWVKINASSGAESGDWGNFDYEDQTLNYDISDGYVVQFCIKSGANEGTSFYEIEGPETDEITIGKEISHTAWRVVFVPETNGGEWCSPGFWMNNPLRVEQTGVDMSQYFLNVFDDFVLSLSGNARRQGATDNPTLQEVLDNPGWYGGEAFNLVGDLLSDAHDDVDFQGDRVEDSCPLSADASGWWMD
jgi:hypothetical protein